MSAPRTQHLQSCFMVQYKWVMGSEPLLLLQPQREKWSMKRFSSSSAWLGLASIYRGIKNKHPFLGNPHCLLKEKRNRENSLCVLLSGIVSQCAAPSTWPPTLLFWKATFLNFQKIACSWKAAIWESSPLSAFFIYLFIYFKYPQSFGFSQPDSKPSAPIRISGLMCFHTLLPHKRPTCCQARLK